MNSPLSFVLPVGSDLSCETWTFSPGFRTEAQFERVRSIAGSPDFAFSCNSRMFEPEQGRPCRGPVTFTWYDRAGVLHATRIGARGEIRSEART